ncbi:MAG TPA: energy-coupling factor transporter transmembrane component T [Bacillota bacterium]|nr:energy-coupling factor transporter transmembrane component T [Bacillota bacterium]
MSVEADPRSKLFAVFCLTTMALLIRQGESALLLAALTIAALALFGVRLSAPFRILRKLVPALLVVSVLQVLLVKAGRPLLLLGSIRLVTTGGLQAALFMAARVGIIASCGSILYSIGFSDFLLAMRSIRVPYELAFMSAMGAKFLPLLAEEMSDSLISAQLRGADLRRMGLVRRLRLYVDVLMPATVTAMSRAEGISWALELKGFNPGKPRTYWHKLEMGMSDWLVLPAGAIAFAAFLAINYRR